MKRLFLIEGLPGTGKTTTTQRLAAHLADMGTPAVTLLEGDDHIPTNFYETAGVPSAAFDAFRAAHPNLTDADCAVLSRTAHYVYLRLDRCAPAVEGAFRPCDMGDELNSRITVPQYTHCALERLDAWALANTENRDTVIIDSGFLQNPVNELLFRDAADAETRAYIHGIAERLAPLHPLCIYLRRETAQTAIAAACKAKGPDWAARVQSLLDTDGQPGLFTRRFALELSLLPAVPHVVCHVDGDDWSEVDALMQAGEIV